MSEELRDVLAQTTRDWLERPGSTVRELADALLSGPIAPLLAAQAVVERVEALAVNPDVCSDYWGAVSVSALRRALDGTP